MQIPPFTLTLFGITGDLSRHKIIPALYELFCHELLPDTFRFIAYARRDLDQAAFHALITTALADTPFPREKQSDFLTHWEYVQGEFSDSPRFAQLANRISETPRHATCYYLAIAPEFYEPVTEQLKNAGLLEQTEHHHPCIIIEKPFGHDSHTAHQLNEQLHRSLSEEHIYRIDHYLGKPAVQAIVDKRFRGEAPFDRMDELDHIQLTLAEAEGIKNRGSYYDTAGAIRDMLQNHCLAIASLLTMDKPESFTAPAIRTTRAKALLAYSLDAYVTGQYASYTHEAGIPETSQTETFVAAKLTHRNSSVPLYIRTGKKLAQKTSTITFVFTDTSKEPVTYSLSDAHNTLSDYAGLFQDCLTQNQTYFVSDQEVMHAWGVVLPALQQTIRPEIYQDGSWGPLASDGLLEADQRRWINT